MEVIGWQRGAMFLRASIFCPTICADCGHRLSPHEFWATQDVITPHTPETNLALYIKVAMEEQMNTYNRLLAQCGESISRLQLHSFPLSLLLRVMDK